MRGFDRVFLGIARISFRFWRSILTLFALLALLSPFLLQGLRIDTASASFIADDDPVSRIYRESLSRFGENDPLVIQIRYGSSERNTVDRFTDRLAEAIAALPDITRVESQPAAFLEGPRTVAMARAALLNSDPAVLDSFAAALAQDAMRIRIRRTRKRIVLAEAPLDRKLLAADPLDIRSLLRPYFETRTQQMRFSFAHGYFDAPDERSRLLFVQPTGSGEDTLYCTALLERMAHCVDAVRQAIPEARGIDCRFTGKHVLTGESAGVLKRDMLRITTIAFGLVLLLLLLVFKSWRAAVVCILPILMAFLPVLLVARLFFNPLNFLATGFAAIIIGLGVDVMLHCTARLFQFTAQDGLGLEEAIGRTLTDCGPPVVVGVFTTAGAFFSLLLADYRALAQFGLLTASGLVVSLVVSLCVFPAVARWLLSGKSPAGGGMRFVGWPVALFSRCWNYPYISLAATAVLILGGLFLARGFAFDTDFARLLPRKLEALDVAADISERHGASFLLNTQLVLESDTYENGLAIQHRVDETLERMVRTGQVAGFYSPTLYFATQSPDATQEARMAQAAAALVANRDVFLAQVEESGFADMESYRDYYARLQRVVASPDDFAAHELPQLEADPQGRRFVSGDAGAYFFQTYIWPRGADAGAATARDAQAVFEAFDVPGGAALHVTGTHRLYEHLHEVVGASFLRVSLIAGLLVTTLILCYFRRAALVALSLLPLLAAIPVTFAMIVLIGIPVSPLGIGVTAIVIGIGIDDAVHILVRARRNHLRDVRRAMVEIGPIITLTSLSSVIGFGALSFADHEVLSSLGKVVAFGVFACWFFSMLSLPAAYLIQGRTARRSLRIGILAIGLLFCGATGVHGADLDRLLRKIETNYDSMEAVSCRFTQTKAIQQLSGEIELTGTLLFKKPHFFSVQLRGDENLDLYCNGKEIRIVDHDLQEIETHAFAPSQDRGRLAQLMPPILFMRTEELKEQFDLQELKGPDRVTRLPFTPKGGNRFSFRELTIDVDRRGRITMARTTYANGDGTTTEFSNWKRLKDVDDARFEYEIPCAFCKSRPR